MTEQSSSLPKIHTYAQDIDSVRADRKKNPKAFSVKSTTPSPVSVSNQKQTPAVPKKVTTPIAKDIEKITSSRKGEIKDSGYKAEIITDKKKPRLTASTRLKNIVKELFTNTKSARPALSNRKIGKSDTSKAYTSPTDYEKVVAHLTKKYDETDTTDTTAVSLKTIPKIDKGDEETTPLIGFSEITTKDITSSANKTTVPNNTPTVPETKSVSITPPSITRPETRTPQPIKTPPIPHRTQVDTTTTKTTFVPPPATPQTPDSIPTPAPTPLPIVSKIEPRINENLAATSKSKPNIPVPAAIQKEIVPELTTAPATTTKSKVFRFLPDIRSITISQLTSLPIIISVIFVFGVTAFIITNTQIFSLRTIVVPATQSTDAIFTSSLIRTLVPSLGTRENIFGQINSIIKSDATVTEVRLLNTFNGERIDGTSLLNILEFSLPVTAKANVTMMTFGSYREEPWIVMNIRDTNTVRGGILQWEVAMPQNLQGLFTITTPGPSDRSSFIDATANTTDVRIFKNREGKEEIVYGFIRPNVLLITTDTLRFQNLQNNFAQ
jgi:hypothetical protein